MDDRVQSPQLSSAEKPYKPKFHNAALYAKVEKQLPPQPALQLLPQPPMIITTAAPTIPIMSSNSNPSFGHHQFHHHHHHLVKLLFLKPLCPYFEVSRS